MRTGTFNVLLASSLACLGGCATRDSGALPVTDGLRLTHAGESEFGNLRVEHVIYRDVENAKNEALQVLLQAGYVPVLVRVENIGPARELFDPRAIHLTDETGELAPVESGDMPHAIDKQSGKIVTVRDQRVLNLGDSLALVGVVIAAIYGHTISSGYQDCSSCSSPTRAEIDYERSFLKAKRLKPGTSTQGLIFFKTTDGREPSWSTLTLVAR